MKISASIVGPNGMVIEALGSSMPTDLELKPGDKLSLWTNLRYEGRRRPKGDLRFPCVIDGDGCSSSIEYSQYIESIDANDFEMKTVGTNVAAVIAQHTQLYRQFGYTYRMVLGRPVIVGSNWLAKLVVTVLNKLLPDQPFQLMIQPIEE